MRLILFYPAICCGELICDYGENCDRLCEAEICDYFWNVEYRYSNSWRTNDFQFGETPFYRSLPLFWNETASRLEIPELKKGYTQGVFIDDIKGENGKTKKPEDNLDELFFIDGHGRQKQGSDNQRK